MFIDFHIISATKLELPDVCKPWPTWNCESIVGNASKLAAQMAVLRQFRGNAEKVGTETLAKAEMRSFQARLARPVCTKKRINEAFVAIPTERAYKGRSRFAAFAQLLVCGLYNAMQNSPGEHSIRLSFEPSALTIVNDRYSKGDHRDHRSLSGGTEVTLRMAYQTLWDHEPPKDIRFEPSDDGETWILEAALPETMWSDPCL